MFDLEKKLIKIYQNEKITFKDIQNLSKLEKISTPKNLSEINSELFKKSGASFLNSPIFIEYKFIDEYLIDECVNNVLHHINDYGGEILYGRSLYTSKILSEAIFHSVWKSPTGELIDITPKADGESTILFVPNHGYEHDGFTKGNIRVPLVEDEFLLKSVNCYNEIDKLMYPYGRPGYEDLKKINNLKVEAQKYLVKFYKNNPELIKKLI